MAYLPRMNLRTLLGAAVAATLTLASAAVAARPPAPAKAAATANAIHVISPYRANGAWVFDDPARGLVREAFVSGADEWMEHMAAGVPGGRERGFTLVFSSKPFPGAQRRLQFRRAEHGGAWYYDAEMKHEGWLCSTLFDYFRSPPREIYAQVKPRA